MCTGYLQVERGSGVVRTVGLRGIPYVWVEAVGFRLGPLKGGRDEGEEVLAVYLGLPCSGMGTISYCRVF